MAAGTEETAELPELPTGWTVRPLAELCDKVSEQVLPSANNSLRYVGLEHIESGSPRLRRWGDSAEVRSAKNKFQSLDVLYGKLRPYLDKGVLADFGGICSTDVLVFRARPDEVLPEYLVHIFHSKPLIKRAVETTAGVNLPRTSWNALKTLLVPLPPKKEQNAIAQVLRIAQDARDAAVATLGAARVVKTSLLKHLFSYGPVPLNDSGSVTTTTTQLGTYPSSWEFLEAEQVAEIEYGVQAAVAHLTDSAVGTPILTNINLTSEGSISLETLRYFQLGDSNRHSLLLQKGDVLFNWRSGSESHVGKTALFDLDGDYTHSSFILRLRPKPVIRSAFLAAYLHWLRLQGHFRRQRNQSSVNSVFNKSILSKLPVPVPTLGEQDRIIEHLATVEAKLAAEQARVSAVEATLSSLARNLLEARLTTSGSYDATGK